MELEPDYKQTEMETIPKEWLHKQLIDICLKIQDGTHFSPKLGGMDYFYVTSKNIGFGKLRLESLEMIDANQHRSIYKRCDVAFGDVLLTKDGASTGNAAINTFQEEISLLSSVAFLRIDSSIGSSQFLIQQLLSEPIQRQIKEAMSGNAITRLTLEKIKKLVIPFAPIKEQQSIAQTLSDTDALIESLEKLIAKKRNIKQGAMQELLTGKRRLPGFSGEWITKYFGELFDFSGGFNASRDQLSSKGYCYLHYGDIHKSSKTFINVKSEHQDIPKLDVSLSKISPASMLNDGDVVFVDASEDDAGTSKHVVIVNKERIPYISGLHTIIAKSKSNELIHQYRQHCFQTEAVKRQFYFFSVGTKVSGISKANIVKITMPVPSIFEQTAIAEILSDIDTEITSLEQKLTKTKMIKQGMMQELLTGRIRLI